MRRRPLHLLLILASGKQSGKHPGKQTSEHKAAALAALLREQGYEPTWRITDTPELFRSALAVAPSAAGTWHAVIAEPRAGFTALQALDLLAQAERDLPLIVWTSARATSREEQHELALLRAGARAILRHSRPALLGPILERELKEADLRREAQEQATEIRKLKSDLKRTTAELRAKIRLLERSNEDLDRFASAASHDLKEPLRMIDSYTHLMLRHHKLNDPEAAEFAGYIREGVGRMRALIDALLSYSRINDAPHVRPNATDPTPVAADVLQSLEPLIGEHKARVWIEGNLPPVQIDQVPLMQIFQNLIANGLKYRRKQETAEVRISALRKNAEVRFAVRDNGQGIPPQHYNRIFELFRRLHGEDVPGLGIGLAMCKRLVERNGGRIWLESKPGAGSTFYFTLPAAELAASVSSASPTTSSAIAASAAAGK
jgi:signal transduction histidine kinase